jgi:hypothetical protein
MSFRTLGRYDFVAADRRNPANHNLARARSRRGRHAVPSHLGFDAPWHCAAGFDCRSACHRAVRPNEMVAIRALRVPAMLLGALLLWATVSTAWSVDPAHSLLISGRLLGLFAACLALTAAADALVCPRRLLRCFYAGLTLALVLAQIQFATDGLLTQPSSRAASLLRNSTRQRALWQFWCCRRVRLSSTRAG